MLKKGKNVMRGSQLTVNLVTGQMVTGRRRKGASNPDGRVQGVFAPNSQTQ